MTSTTRMDVDVVVVVVKRRVLSPGILTLEFPVTFAYLDGPSPKGCVHSCILGHAT